MLISNRLDLLGSRPFPADALRIVKRARIIYSRRAGTRSAGKTDSESALEEALE